MICMCINRGCFATWESKICSVCVLTGGAVLDWRVSYVLYVY